MMIIEQQQEEEEEEEGFFFLRTYYVLGFMYLFSSNLHNNLKDRYSYYLHLQMMKPGDIDIEETV